MEKVVHLSELTINFIILCLFLRKITSLFVQWCVCWGQDFSPSFEKSVALNVAWKESHFTFLECISRTKDTKGNHTTNIWTQKIRIYVARILRTFPYLIMFTWEKYIERASPCHSKCEIQVSNVLPQVPSNDHECAGKNAVTSVKL